MVKAVEQELDKFEISEEGLDNANAVISAINGWFPNNIVSDSGKSLEQKSLFPTAQPDRKPGAAWLFDIDDTVTVLLASALRNLGEKNSPIKIRSSYTSSDIIHKSLEMHNSAMFLKFSLKFRFTRPLKCWFKFLSIGC